MSRTVIVDGSSIGGGGATGFGAATGAGVPGCGEPGLGAGRVAPPGLGAAAGVVFVGDAAGAGRPPFGPFAGIVDPLFNGDSGRGAEEGRVTVAGRAAPAGRGGLAVGCAVTGRGPAVFFATVGDRGVSPVPGLATDSLVLGVAVRTTLRGLRAGDLPALSSAPVTLFAVFSTIATSLRNASQNLGPSHGFRLLRVLIVRSSEP